MSALPTTLAEAAAAIAAGRLSPVELTEAALRRIELAEPQVRAFELLCAEQALEAARRAERALAAGPPAGPLHGIPVGVKDVFDTAGVATTASSPMLAGRVPRRDAAAVARLRAAGAIVLGKTRTVELAVGVAETPARNPWDPTRLPGGSSAGSAAAVAAGECLLGLGSDTGGSVRIPATLCGLTGLRPTFGRISRDGMLPASWSLDQPGPLARTALDVALALDALCGADRRDPATLPDPERSFAAAIDDGADGLVLGLATNLLPRVDDEVAAAFATALDQLRALGVRIREVELPLLEHVMPAYLLIALPEAGAAHRELLRERGEHGDPGVRAVLEAGQLVPVADHLRAQRARRLHQQAWRELFAREAIDAVVAPGLPVLAPPADAPLQRWPDGATEDLAGACAPACIPSTLTGLPTLAFPCGRSGGGLPIGAQLIGRPLEEALLLRVAHAFEAVTPWARSAPPPFGAGAGESCDGAAVAEESE